MKSLIIVAILSVVGRTRGSCITGAKEHNGNCYMGIPSNDHGYAFAENFCKYVNGTVTMVKTQDVQTFLNQEYSSYYYYINMKRSGSSWIHGDNTAASYFNWDSSEPASSGDCVMASVTTGKWKAVSCTHTTSPQMIVCAIGTTGGATTTVVAATTTVAAVTTVPAVTTTVQAAATTAAGTVCTSHANCQLSQLCSGGVCTETSVLTNCPCTSPRVCEQGKCIISSTATTAAPTTTHTPTVCTSHANCMLGELCSGGSCTSTSQLTACPSGTCTSGTCEHGYCVQSSTTTPASCLGKDPAQTVNNGGQYGYEPISIALTMVMMTSVFTNAPIVDRATMAAVQKSVNDAANSTSYTPQQKANAIRKALEKINGLSSADLKAALLSAYVQNFGTVTQWMACINETKCSHIGLLVASNTTVIANLNGVCTSGCGDLEKIVLNMVVTQVQATLNSGTMTESEKVRSVITSMKLVAGSTSTDPFYKSFKSAIITGVGAVSDIVEC